MADSTGHGRWLEGPYSLTAPSSERAEPFSSTLAAGLEQGFCIPTILLPLVHALVYSHHLPRLQQVTRGMASKRIESVMAG